MRIGLLVAWLVFGWMDQIWIDADSTTPTRTTVADDDSVRATDGGDEIPPRP